MAVCYAGLRRRRPLQLKKTRTAISLVAVLQLLSISFPSDLMDKELSPSITKPSPTRLWVSPAPGYFPRTLRDSPTVNRRKQRLALPHVSRPCLAIRNWGLIESAIRAKILKTNASFRSKAINTEFNDDRIATGFIWPQ